MTATSGRGITLTWGGSALKGAREKSVTVGGEPINVTSEEDDGWQTLIDELGERSVNIEISGVDKDDVLRVEAHASTRTATAVLITYKSGATLAGNFYLSAYSEGMPYNDAATFSATIMSTGAMTYTPAA